MSSTPGPFFKLKKFVAGPMKGLTKGTLVGAKLQIQFY